MKKFLMAALLMMGVGSMQAQEALEKQKAFDNVYLGVEAGASTRLDFNKTFPLNGAAGVKFGKWFSPVWGGNIETLLSFGDNRYSDSKTFVKELSLGANLDLSLTNLFKGFREDRTFELIAEGGVAYARFFGDAYRGMANNGGDDSELLAKTALMFAWNLGEAKKWQFYVEPGVMWNLSHGPGDAIQFGHHDAQFGIMAGLNYKFKTSNGTHNFKVWNIDDLNNEINDLRAQLAAKPKEVVKEVIKEVEVVKEVKTEKLDITENLVFVTYAQGKSILTNEAKQALNKIKAGRHVQIVGTCSPEGSKELNDRLSQARADVVADYLKGRGVIIDEATGKGVQGTTSNRLAIVYVVQ